MSDSIAVEAWRQRVHKERRAIVHASHCFGGSVDPPDRGPRPPRPSTAAPTARSPPKSCEAATTVYDRVYAATPRGTIVNISQPIPSTRPQTANSQKLYAPHQRHHYGYGWFDAPKRPATARGPQQGPVPGSASKTTQPTAEWPRLSHAWQHSEGLMPSPPATPTATRRAPCKPRPIHPAVQPHQPHFITWPGKALYVPPTKHFYKPEVASRKEMRGELPPTLQMLVSAGSRPGFPICACLHHMHRFSQPPPHSFRPASAQRPPGVRLAL